jgi:hypothetical protein
LQLKHTIPIAYHPGTYGTYLEWLLTTLCSSDNIFNPLCSNGSSHNFKGNHLSFISGMHEYAGSDQYSQFVRWHPKSKKDESLSANLECALEYVDKMIYIYPNADCKLLTINNCFSKIRNLWTNQLKYEILPEKIYANWPVDKNTPLEEIPRWIQREFLSLYLMDSWHDQTEWYHLDRWSHPRCHVILISDLLYNLDDALNSIKKYFNLHFVKSIDQIRPYHQKMLESQSNLGQDQLCEKIVSSVLSDQDFSWPTLPLVSECWIQWQLRNQGFELQCNELDIFPTNSLQLRKLIYPI